MEVSGVNLRGEAYVSCFREAVEVWFVLVFKYQSMNKTLR